MAPELRIFSDRDRLGEAAAAELARRAAQAVAARGRFSVALAGGSTPRHLYELLATPPLRDGVPWSWVDFFWGDERAVPPDHPASNFGMARAALLDKLDLVEARIHRMQAERPDREAAARAYQNEMARVLAAPAGGAPPRLDLVLLGLGSDGHTASLFPHTPALDETSRWVVPNQSPDPPRFRLTLTAPAINAAAGVMFIVAGADKATAVASVLEGPHRPHELPAQLVRPAGGTVLWFLDRAAATGLCGAPTSGAGGQGSDDRDLIVDETRR